MANKKYRVYFQFEAQEVIVSAKNKKEARAKVVKRLKVKTAWSIADKKNYFIDECSGRKFI